MSNMTPSAVPILPSQRGEPAWEIATLFPPQGYWSVPEYLALDTNRIVELVSGCIEVHPMPSLAHQLLVGFFYRWLDDFIILHKLGLVLFAPFPVKVLTETYREPDILFLKPGRLQGTNPRSVVGADLAIEIVSEGAENRKRDLETKPAEFAAAGISEYWIVDPQLQSITVLTLDGPAYRVHGVFRIGDRASSVLLPGLTLAVADAFAAAQAAG
jgi:Uma2 family endonuclease